MESVREDFKRAVLWEMGISNPGAPGQGITNVEVRFFASFRMTKRSKKLNYGN